MDMEWKRDGFVHPPPGCVYVCACAYCIQYIHIYVFYSMRTSGWKFITAAAASDSMLYTYVLHAERIFYITFGRIPQRPRVTRFVHDIPRARVLMLRHAVFRNAFTTRKPVTPLYLRRGSVCVYTRMDGLRMSE